MRIKVDREYYESGDEIYQFNSLTLNPGVTVLVGCNGSGKSTLLRMIQDHCNKKKIVVVSYDDERNGRSHAMDKMGFFGDIQGIAANFISSEGEKIRNNFGKFVRSIRSTIINNPQSVILLDGLDSGQSIDSLVELKDLFQIILEDAEAHGVKCYIIITANSYELARGHKCIDVTTGKRRKFSSYEKYKQFVVGSSEYKAARYAKLDNSSK